MILVGLGAKRNNNNSQSLKLERFTLSGGVLALTDVIPNDNTPPENNEGYQLFSETLESQPNNPVFLNVEIPYVQISTTGYVNLSVFVNGSLLTFRTYRVTTGATTGNALELNTVFTPNTNSTTVVVRVGVGVNTTTLTLNSRFGGMDVPKLNVVYFDKAASSSASIPEDLLAKFEAILSVSQYQGDWASGATRVTYQGSSLLSRPNTQYFSFDKQTGVMVFSGFRDSSFQFRSELRHLPEWLPTQNGALTIEMQLSDTTLGEVTFAQIHRKDTGSVSPPVRFVLGKSATINGVTYTDYLFAVVRRNNGVYQTFPLVPKPEGVFKFQARLNNYSLTVEIDDVNVLTHDVSEWVGYNLYFKLGVYLTGSTTIAGSIVNTVHSTSASIT